jgi:hypothetical protein
MWRFSKLRLYLVYAGASTLLLFAMPGITVQFSTAPAALFEQLGGTEVPNPVFDNVLTIARDTLSMLANMIPG